jgi:hypothetical protein
VEGLVPAGEAVRGGGAEGTPAMRLFFFAQPLNKKIQAANTTEARHAATSALLTSSMVYQNFG